MSAKKRKSGGNIARTYDTIMEALSKIKPSLDDPTCPNRQNVERFHHVASLAEAFIEHRTKSTPSTWSHLADSLDQEGVNLWNLSGLIAQSSNPDARALVAAQRLAAFRLVEAGLEPNPGIETLVHMLQMACKASTALCEVGNYAGATSVLTSAAEFEERLRGSDDPEGKHRQVIACARSGYFAARMEAAWREENHGLADFMSSKITEDISQLLPIRTRELLAFKHYEIGKSIMQDSDSPNRPSAQDALSWLQRAFNLIDQVDDSNSTGDSASPGQLKISILRTMARAYFLVESYDRAQTVLDELGPMIDSVHATASSEYQELRWLKLSVLKQRKASDAALLDAFISIINHMEFTESNVTDLLQDLKTLSHHHALVTAVNRHCLEKALLHHATEPEHVHRLIPSLIIHCSKDVDHQRAMSTLDVTFTSLCEADLELPPVVATACLTLIWQYGGRHFRAKKWVEAAEWYVVGSHRLFKSSSPSSAAKCFRKAALCYIEKRDFAQASAVIRRCPSNEAPTNYVMFLIAVNQGLQEEAIRALHDMVKAPDFDRKMLLLATQISHTSEMKPVLLTALECLLKAVKGSTNGEEFLVESMTLIRCIIKLALNLLTEPTADKSALIDIVVNHFRTARILANTASAHKSVSVVFKDISWLWRSAYNCATLGCSEWDEAAEKLSELFSIAKSLLETCCDASPVDTDAKLYQHLANASFATVSAQVFALRETMTTGPEIDDGRLRSVASDIRVTKEKMLHILKTPGIQDAQDSDRIHYFIHALSVFEAELCIHLKEWNRVVDIIQEIGYSGPLAVGTYEAIADILWLSKVAPVNVLSKCLEAILRLSLERNTLSIEKFSRWLRAICTITLARDTAEDRLKAIGYIEQAINVIKEHNGATEGYPMDERQWLLATAFNVGTECFHASQLDEAKRWFEAATVICRFVPGGQAREEKISETYSRLLTRFGSRR